LKEQAFFTLDLDRCTGCSACAIACRTENRLDEWIEWRHIHTFNEQRLPGAAVFHYSLACNHCGEPACLHGCPANAFRKDPATGAVLLDDHRCLGCQYCTWVCPYGAPQFNEARGIVEKCTFCSHRLEMGLRPACVHACPVDALGFVEVGIPKGARLPGFPEAGLDPAIRLETRRRRAQAPEMTAEVVAWSEEPTPSSRTRTSQLRSEWPLLTFTLLAAGLVAWVSSRLFLGEPIQGFGFLAAGSAAMMIGTLHLGRPMRAWRALSNLRSSWVSREVAVYPAFLLAVGACGFTAPPSPMMAWVTIGLGFAALVCVDMVYRIPGMSVRAVPHSAMTTLTAAFLAGLLIVNPWLTISAALIKLVLYLLRPGMVAPGNRGVSAVRIGLGFVAPAVAWAAGTESISLLLVGPLLGEILDRAQFYEELDFLSPQRQIDLDLAKIAGRSTARAPGRLGSI
jgi:Fe-S-cluster-containing dehydrogenase component